MLVKTLRSALRYSYLTIIIKKSQPYWADNELSLEYNFESFLK